MNIKKNTREGKQFVLGEKKIILETLRRGENETKKKKEEQG